jgi:uncharacterized protein YigE (DUF2233 family)
MRAALLLSLLLLGCRQAVTEPASEQPAQDASSCRRELFEESSFTVCAERGGTIEVRGGKRSFAALGLSPERIAFAVNAGMFDDAGRAIGLLVEDGREIKAINRRKGSGNFHLLPNGVFLVRTDGTAAVVTSEEYKPADDIAFSTQSGPMLLIDGKLHPKFDPDGESRYIRNGVGIAPDETATFVISNEPVSFGKFARFFRNRVQAEDALYFDGSVSSLWDPAAGRQDSFVKLGPIVVVYRRGAVEP